MNMAKSHLNTNKQFMIGNGILAFAVIFVVVIFVYMGLRLSRKEGIRQYQEVYTVNIDSSLTGDSIDIFINDSLIFRGIAKNEGELIRMNRFSENNSMLVVDKTTDFVSTFGLEDSGETITLYRKDNIISRK